ncbi:cell cycle checkpoint protein RAD17 [Silurus meridionalis]|nr:cell cycle checkpoint protein RAD17 [Silurus meridionalis]
MSKLSLGRKTSSGKLSSWVQPSFGDFFAGSGLNSVPSSKGLSGESKSKARSSSTDVGGKKPKKRKGEPQCSKPEPGIFSNRQGSQDEPWVDVHAPQTQAELAVHKKKVEEVETWLKDHLDTKSGNKLPQQLTNGSIPGVSAPSQQIQPAADERRRCRGSGEEDRPRRGAVAQYKAMSDLFGLWGTCFEPPDRFPVIYPGLLVPPQDFPNQFYRQPGCLHDILRRYRRTGRCPLVFIVSDSLSGDTSSRLLFPKDVQEELSIHSISFNPVAPTSMMKVLSRIATLEASKSAGRNSVPDKATLEQLCSGSSGDVRSAINSLQFFSYTGADFSLEQSLWASKKGKSSTAASKPRSKGRGRPAKASTALEESPAIGGKDASLFLFRALGKILYCKRESYEEGDVPELPAHLSEHQRDKLLVDPELVIERSHMSGEFFNLYLHQNYVDFFSDVEDVARASEYLSDADFLTAEWTSRSTMLGYGSSVATRGLIHSNAARAQAAHQSSVGFKPLHKPHWLHINKTFRENYLTAQSLFISFCLTPVSLVTELQLEALGDKDPGLLDLDSDHEDTGTKSTEPSTQNPLSGETIAVPTLPNSQEPGGDLPASQPQPTTSQALLDEEDLLIEEYDSD